MAEEIQVLRPAGRLDGDTSPALEREALAMIDGGARRLLIDCNEIEYISSAGIRAALSVAKRMLQVGGRISVCSLKPQVAQVFEISGVDGILDVQPSLASATWGLLDG